jgi:hypothetical protein
MKVEYATKESYNKRNGNLIEGLATISSITSFNRNLHRKPVIRGLSGNRVLVYTGVRMGESTIW